MGGSPQACFSTETSHAWLFTVVISYSELTFSPASNSGENPSHSGLVLLFGSRFVLCFPGGRPLASSSCLPYLGKGICFQLPEYLKGSLGFVDQAEKTIVAAGLGEHTFWPQISPFCRKPNKKYIYNSFWAQNLDLSRTRVLQGISVFFWKSVEVKEHQPSRRQHLYKQKEKKTNLLSGIITQLSWTGNKVGEKYRNFVGTGGGRRESQPFV